MRPRDIDFEYDITLMCADHQAEYRMQFAAVALNATAIEDLRYNATEKSHACNPCHVAQYRKLTADRGSDEWILHGGVGKCEKHTREYADRIAVIAPPEKRWTDEALLGAYELSMELFHKEETEPCEACNEAFRALHPKSPVDADRLKEVMRDEIAWDHGREDREKNKTEQ